MYNNSILLSVKKNLGITEEYTHFDKDIIMHINTYLNVLYQLGVGSMPLVIEDDKAEWTDLVGDRNDLETIKTYLYIKVRMVFDPPTSSILAEALNKSASELEWRINSTVDYPT